MSPSRRKSGAASKDDAMLSRKAGERMPDGSIYAGLSPTTGSPMYTTPADAPHACTFREARRYAFNLDAHGNRDWRVPTRAEMKALLAMRDVIDGLGSSCYLASAPGTKVVAALVASSAKAVIAAKPPRASLRCVRAAYISPRSQRANKAERSDFLHWRDKGGRLHRKDGPALRRLNGDKWWYRHGRLHRVDGPAIEWANGDKGWYRKDLLHRGHGPAIRNADGTRIWYRHGLLHRKNGPAVRTSDGSLEWYVNGVPHRSGAPAVESANGDREWWLHGLRHRMNGPAMICANGNKYWYRRGQLMPGRKPPRKSPVGKRS
jgi:hypothetical protein